MSVFDAPNNWHYLTGHTHHARQCLQAPPDRPRRVHVFGSQRRVQGLAMAVTQLMWISVFWQRRLPNSTTTALHASPTALP